MAYSKQYMSLSPAVTCDHYSAWETSHPLYSTRFSNHVTPIQNAPLYFIALTARPLPLTRWQSFVALIDSSPLRALLGKRTFRCKLFPGFLVLEEKFLWLLTEWETLLLSISMVLILVVVV